MPFKEHGATNLVECWGDDVPEGKLTSLTLAVNHLDARNSALFANRKDKSS